MLVEVPFEGKSTVCILKIKTNVGLTRLRRFDIFFRVSTFVHTCLLFANKLVRKSSYKRIKKIICHSIYQVFDILTQLFVRKSDRF